MKLSELMICIAIYSLTISICFFSYKTFQKSQKNVIEKAFENNIILETDKYIRTFVEEKEFFYWKNVEDKEKQIQNELKKKYANSNIKILDTEKWQNANGNCGVCVLWEYKSKIYKTIASFNIRNFLGIKE